MRRFLKSLIVAGVSFLAVSKLETRSVAADDKEAVRDVLLTFVSNTVADKTKPMTSREFGSETADLYMYKMELAKLGVDKAANMGIQKFAQTLVDDQADIYDDFKAFAKDNKICIVPVVTKENKDNLAELSNLTGKQFDKKFLELVAECNQSSLKILANATKSIKDAAVKDMCKKAIPTVQKQIYVTQRLQKICQD